MVTYNEMSAKEIISEQITISACLLRNLQNNEAF